MPVRKVRKPAVGSKKGRVSKVKKSSGVARRAGRAPLGGGVSPVAPKPRRRKQRKPAKPKMRLGKRG